MKGLEILFNGEKTKIGVDEGIVKAIFTIHDENDLSLSGYDNSNYSLINWKKWKIKIW